MTNETRKASIVLAETNQSVTVDANFSTRLLKINRHGTKIVRVFVYCYEGEQMQGLKNFKGKCGLMKKGQGINWYFPDDCPEKVARKVIEMFEYQELEDYIEGLPV